MSHVGPFWALPIGVGGATLQAVIDTRSTAGFSFTPESALVLTWAGKFAAGVLALSNAG